jgi:hypothetical protein
MVLSPLDALRCFRRTQLDHLVLGRRIVARKDLPPLRPGEAQGAIALD